MSIYSKILTYIHLTNTLELCGLFAGLLLLRRKPDPWRYFIPQLMLTVIVELSGWYLSVFLHIRQNALPFNFLMLTNISFLIWFFRQQPLFTNNKTLLTWLAICFMIAALANLRFGQGPWTYNYFSEAAGDMIIAALCLLFFYRHLQDETYRSFFDDPWFWLINGLFFSSMGNAILYLYLDELAEYYRNTHIDLYGIVNDILNTIYYGSLIVAFVCRHRLTRSSPAWS